MSSEMWMAAHTRARQGEKIAFVTERVEAYWQEVSARFLCAAERSLREDKFFRVKFRDGGELFVFGYDVDQAIIRCFCFDSAYLEATGFENTVMARCGRG